MAVGPAVLHHLDGAPLRTVWQGPCAGHTA